MSAVSNMLVTVKESGFTISISEETIGILVIVGSISMLFGLVRFVCTLGSKSNGKDE